MSRSASCTRALLCLALAAGCSGDGPTGSGEPGSPGLSIVAGANAADTIDALLTQALVVAMHDLAGRPMADVFVRFTPITGPPATTPMVRIGLLDAKSLGSSPITLRTDERGRAAVLVRLGQTAGTARLRVDAPDLGHEAIASVQVEPGAPHVLAAAPEDTALYVGASVAVTSIVRDRVGNAIPATPTFSPPADGSPIALAAGSVHAERIGRGFVVAVHGALADTTWISVMPRGTIVAYEPPAFESGSGGTVTLPPRLVLLELDGSQHHTLLELTPTQSFGGLNDGPQPRWAPSGTEVAYIRFNELRAVNLAGTTRLIVGAPRRVWHDFSPEYGPNGEWIYFTLAEVPESGPTLRRVRPDGTGEEPTPADWPQPAAPGPAPTGNLVAYQTHGYLSSVIRLFDAGTGARIALDVPGRWPRWSPTGEWIAYLDLEGRLRVMRPDGSGRRLVAGGIFANGNYTWSPDGEWIIISGAQYTADDPFRVGLSVVNVASGEVLPLRLSRTIIQPSWRP